MPLEQFSSLTPTERVEAILATIREPMTKEGVLELADIDAHNLDAETARNINGLFERWKQPGSDSPEGVAYWVPREEQEAVINRIGVDARSVHRRITSIGREILRKAAIRMQQSKKTGS